VLCGHFSKWWFFFLVTVTSLERPSGKIRERAWLPRRRTNTSEVPNNYWVPATTADRARIRPCHLPTHHRTFIRPSKVTDRLFNFFLCITYIPFLCLKILFFFKIRVRFDVGPIGWVSVIRRRTPHESRIYLYNIIIIHIESIQNRLYNIKGKQNNGIQVIEIIWCHRSYVLHIRII